MWIHFIINSSIYNLVPRFSHLIKKRAYNENSFLNNQKLMFYSVICYNSIYIVLFTLFINKYIYSK